ncbi:AAA family ATPase [Frankia sp. CcWB2]
MSSNTTVFVGRSAELGQLAAQFAAAVAAYGCRCVLVEGRAGVGKTTLLNRFLTDLAVEPVPNGPGSRPRRKLR